MVDTGNRIMELKWSWTKHLARRGDGKWNKAVTEWRSRTGKRSVGRPVARWAKNAIAMYILDEAGTGTWSLAKRGLCPAVDEVSLWIIDE